MDLRGLDPEDVYKLMNAGIGLRGVEENESANMVRAILGDQHLSQQAKQNAVENYFKQIKTGLDIREANRPRDPGTFTVNGKVYMRYVDPATNTVQTKEMGDATEKGQNLKLLRTPQGKLMWAKPGDSDIPDNSTYVPQGTGEHPLSISDQGMLMSLQRIVEQGQDINGNSYESDADRDNAAAVVNASSPNIQYVKVAPGVDSPWYDPTSLDKSAQYVKIPKSLQAIKALPDTTPLGLDEKTGQPVTMGQMKAVAKKTNQPLEAVLKFFNIQYK